MPQLARRDDNPTTHHQSTPERLRLALLASSVGDPAGTRTITSIVLLLAVLGIALLMLAIWLFRLTRPDKELLAPLEVMGERKWRRADPVWQRRRLDEVRPSEAQPLQPSAAPPDFDEAFFEQRPAAGGFADLHDDAHATANRRRRSVAPVAAADAPRTGRGSGSRVHRAGSPTARRSRPSNRSRRLAVKPVSPTPIGIERPMELPDRDIDPERAGGGDRRARRRAAARPRYASHKRRIDASNCPRRRPSAQRYPGRNGHTRHRCDARSLPRSCVGGQEAPAATGRGRGAPAVPAASQARLPGLRHRSATPRPRSTTASSHCASTCGRRTRSPEVSDVRHHVNPGTGARHQRVRPARRHDRRVRLGSRPAVRAGDGRVDTDHRRLPVDHRRAR